MTAQNNVVATQDSLNQVAALNDLDLKSLGLTVEDHEKILNACNELNEFSQSKVSFFGQGLAQHSQKHTDELLAQVQNKDLDETGKKIDSVLKAAKTINTNNLLVQPKKSFLNKGFLGTIFGKISNVKDNFLSEFKTTKEQVETLLGEVEKSQSGLSDRIVLLETMFNAVEDECKELGIYIAAGQIKRQELAKNIDELSLQSANDQSGVVSAQVFELNGVANSLDKRIGDLRMLQQSALQTLPMIRVIQTNNSMLVEKFNTIKAITLPAWKNSITLALSLAEQQNSVKLAETIDDTTNDLLRRNAEMLHQNSIDTAKANQRDVIDIETLEYVQKSLIKTLVESAEIQKEGMRKRGETAIKLKDLRTGLADLTISTAQNTTKLIDNK